MVPAGVVIVVAKTAWHTPELLGRKSANHASSSAEGTGVCVFIPSVSDVSLWWYDGSWVG